MWGKKDPVFEARENVRQICKHLVQVEDHLRMPDRRCSDCVDKHLSAAESYADELSSLRGAEAYKDEARAVQMAVRQAYRMLEGGAPPEMVANYLRPLRKECARKVRGFQIMRGGGGGPLAMVKRYATPRNLAYAAAGYAAWRLLR